MSILWMRWIFAVVLSAMGFILWWACLEFGAHVDAPVALGWAILPFSVVLVLSGDDARQDSDKSHGPADPKDASNRPKAKGW
jgi:hypothetical protein